MSFSEIDESVKSIEPAVNPAQLAYTLTKDYSTDKEKLRSIFSWITDHISYRVKKNNLITISNCNNRPDYADTTRWESANEMVAALVLKNKSAVCDGYARLFKTLCDYAGIRAAIITGFAKADLSRQLIFRCNHTWNAVYIDSAWRLLDVTWASGYTSYRGDEFFKHYDEKYFLAAPEEFIRDHFPDDVRWTLLEQPALPHEFNNSPYKNKSFGKYKINAYSPGTGIIEAALGDTIQIELQTSDPIADNKMAADTIADFDSSMEKYSLSVAVVEPSFTDKNKQILHYNFYVQDASIEWLHIVYNKDAILRYRLKIKPEKTGIAITGKTSPLSAPFFPENSNTKIYISLEGSPEKPGCTTSIGTIFLLQEEKKQRV